MSFVDELNQKNGDSVDFQRPRKEDIEVLIVQFKNELRNYCLFKQDDHSISKYIAVEYDSDFSGSIVFQNIKFKNNIDPYPSKVKLKDCVNTREEVYVSKDLKGKYYFHNNSHTGGIYSKEIANILANRIKSVLTDMGFFDISVQIEPLKLKRTSKIRKLLLSGNEFKINYLDLNQTGYLVHFNASW